MPEPSAARGAPDPPSILVVDDEEMMLTMLTRELPRLGFHVTTAPSGEKGVALAAGEDFAVAVVDMLMPGMDGLETLRRLRQESPATEVLVLTGHGTIEGAVEAMRAGAFDYLTKPVRLAELAEVLSRAVERRTLRRENAALKLLVAGRGETGELIAVAPAMRTLLARIERTAATDSPVVLQGESGTGKELLVRALHELSPRRSHPLVEINCSAIQETLLESELFGHQRGAFTGAVERRLGLMEAADGGTLFLDEVAEMSPAVQPKVLRALQSGEIRRVGENRTIRVDVRIVAATNKDLAAEKRAGRFREDLYYRLSAVTLEVPPLRERREDVEPLVRHFIATLPIPDKRVRDVSPEALEALRAYAWPGNVRELRNTIESMLILAPGPRLEAADLPPTVAAGRARSSWAIDAEIRPLEDVANEYVRVVVERSGGNKSRAAKLLGIDLKTLYSRLRRS
jgi:DNA-binding NtrC family response regulator